MNILSYYNANIICQFQITRQISHLFEHVYNNLKVPVNILRKHFNTYNVEMLKSSKRQLRTPANNVNHYICQPLL